MAQTTKIDFAWKQESLKWNLKIIKTSTPVNFLALLFVSLRSFLLSSLEFLKSYQNWNNTTYFFRLAHTIRAGALIEGTTPVERKREREREREKEKEKEKKREKQCQHL